MLQSGFPELHIKRDPKKHVIFCFLSSSTTNDSDNMARPGNGHKLVLQEGMHFFGVREYFTSYFLGCVGEGVTDRVSICSILRQLVLP